MGLSVIIGERIAQILAPQDSYLEQLRPPLPGNEQAVRAGIISNAIQKSGMSRDLVARR